MRVRPARHALLPLLLVLATTAAGCNQPEPQRQYTPRGPGTSVRSGLTEPGTLSYPSPRAGSAYADPSLGMATVASTVPGAGSVSVVALGNVALIGLPNNDPGVHRKIAEQLRSSFPHLAEVRVTTDPALIGRLFEADELIRTQRSIAPLLTDLGARINTLAPVR